jgi:hypothetical protein
MGAGNWHGLRFGLFVEAKRPLTMAAVTLDDSESTLIVCTHGSVGIESANFLRVLITRISLPCNASRRVAGSAYRCLPENAAY